MSTSDDSYIVILRNAFVYINVYILPILFLIGNIGNVLSALIFLKKSWKKNVCVFYFNICLLIETCYINSGLLAAFFTFGLNIHAEISSAILCKLLYYVAYLFSTLFPTLLILASIDRLLISSQNIHTRLYSSKRLAYFSVSISTAIWIVFYIHALIKIDVFEIYPTIVVCYYETSGVYFEFISYVNVIINVILAVILIILSILTFKNIRRIRAVPQRQQRNQIRTMNKKDFQLLRCLYVHDIIYIIFVAFPSVYNIYRAIRKHVVHTPRIQAMMDFVENFGFFIHHIPFCLSFIIFMSVSRAFRLEIRKILQRICGKCLIATPEEDTRQQSNPNDNIELNVVNHNVVPH